MHRLASALGEIQDSQPAEAQRDSNLGVGPGCIVIRAAVAQGFSHLRHDSGKPLVVLFARRIDEASKTAHSEIYRVSKCRDDHLASRRCTRPDNSAGKCQPSIREYPQHSMVESRLLDHGIHGIHEKDLEGHRYLTYSCFRCDRRVIWCCSSLLGKVKISQLFPCRPRFPWSFDV